MSAAFVLTHDMFFGLLRCIFCRINSDQVQIFLSPRARSSLAVRTDPNQTMGHFRLFLLFRGFGFGGSSRPFLLGSSNNSRSVTILRWLRRCSTKSSRVARSRGVGSRAGTGGIHKYRIEEIAVIGRVANIQHRRHSRVVVSTKTFSSTIRLHGLSYDQ